MSLDPVSYNLAKNAYRLTKKNQKDIQDIQGVIQYLRRCVDDIYNKLRSATKLYVLATPVPLGFNNQYPVFTEYIIPPGQDYTVIDMSILFQLQLGETQTVEVHFYYTDGTAYTIEISASSAEGTIVEKRLSNYHYYIAMGGSYPPSSRTILSKLIGTAYARAKTNLLSNSTKPIFFTRYLRFENL